MHGANMKLHKASSKIHQQLRGTSQFNLFNCCLSILQQVNVGQITTLEFETYMKSVSFEIKARWCHVWLYGFVLTMH